jgi:hypothetical protein
MQGQTPEESVLLRLVRKEPLAEALRSCEAGALARAASRHKVLNPLAERLLGEEVDPAWRRIGAAMALTAERDTACSMKALARSVALLESVGIHPVVLKGLSLAMGRPRDCGDVDLLIPEPALADAISALEGEGFEYAGFERNLLIRKSEYRDWRKLSRWSIQFEFLEPETKILVELHTAFFETGRMYAEDMRNLRSAMPEFISRSEIDPATGYRFLRIDDRALLLALHVGLKRSPSNKSFILRHILDFEALMRAGLDWDALARDASRFGASHHLLLLLSLYERVSGRRIDKGIVDGVSSLLGKRSERAVRLHARCLRSLDSYSTIRCFAYKLVSPFVVSGTFRSRLKAALILPLALPPPYQLAQIYHLPSRSPLAYVFYLAEPLQWILRMLKRIMKALRSPKSAS